MKKVCVVCFSILCLIGLTSFYVFTNILYNPFMVIKTELGDINIGFKTDSQVVECIKEKIVLKDVNIHIKEDKDYSFSDIFKVSEQELNKAVKTLDKKLFEDTQFLSLQNILQVNEEKINEIIKVLTEDNIQISSEDAKISFDIIDNKYKIEKEKYGNIFVENINELLIDEIENFRFNINIEEINGYIKPLIIETDVVLRNNFKEYEKLNTFSLSYSFGESIEKIDVSELNKWVAFELDKEGRIVENSYIVNKELIKDYVEELSKKYNTIWCEHTFTTSLNENIVLNKGDYGWWLNKDKMVEDIIEHILQNKSEEKEPIFKQKAELFGEKDFSDNYVEISIENQRLWMYVKGKCIVDSPIVSGCVSKGHSTPTGIYSLTYKTRNAVLRGGDYASFVYYWMPFNGGIGLHDATWRNNFGGTIYRYNGSHGCINMPLKNAKIVYENLKNTMPIIVW